MSFLKGRVHFLFLMVMFLCVEVGLLKLAYWQHNRAQEKEVLRSDIVAAAEINASWPPKAMDVGKTVTLHGTFIPEATYLLEHQQKQVGAGVRTGWRVFGLLQIPDAPAVWIDRGWTAYPRGQERLKPDLAYYETPRGMQDITGIVKAFKPRQVGSWGGATTTTHPRILAFLSEDYLKESYPWAHEGVYVQSMTPTAQNMEAIAAPLPAPGRHREYMFTWLGLALALPMLFGGAVWARRRKMY